MKYQILLLTIIIASCSENVKQNTDKMSVYPKAKKVNKELQIHNDTRIDPYYWMNDRNDPEVIDYLNAENDYTKSVMKHTDDFQEALFQEMKGRIKEDDQSVPYKFNGYFYYSRFEKGNEYAINCRKKGSLDNEEEIIVDQNVRAKGHDYYALGGLSISDNNKLVAIGEDTVSRRIYHIQFMDLETGEMLSDRLENTTGGITWAADNKTVFYSQKDETLRSYKIYRHVLGTSQEEDVLVFHEDDATFNTFVYRTKSRQFIIIGSGSTLSTEYKYLDANDPLGEFTVFQKREDEHEYGIAHYDGYWYVSTNWNAKNFRLMRTPVGKTEKEHWEEVIPHREDVLLEDLEIFNDYLVLGERQDGLTKLRIMPWDGSEEHYIKFNDPAYMVYTSVNRDYDTKVLRYGYTSLTTPSSLYDYNMETREQELLKQQEVVGGYNVDEYESKRFMATARDGKKVPISLVYKKSLKRPEGNPMLLYAYGSYGYSIDPGFSSTRLTLLDRGFVFAIAHIRGSQTLGREWYEDGKMMNKKNTFFDFIDCAEFLIEEKYTTSDHLYAMGGSAGGLLMGAIINYRPDLWNGVVAAVPFVDVVTTMLDESIPLTTGEFDEWGNPKEEEAYHYIKSYSPYDNVEAKDYPNMLVTTGLHDSQVQYWEPAKWVAKLRDMKTDNNILLLKTNMEAGHGGASGRFEGLKETALEYAFFLDLEGITK
ncbi:S9 family peptidase [bacterium SCSIO 12643]|nr:S9 family peptidase [bacterium SCSIO 12643]